MKYKIIEKTNKRYIEVSQAITCESYILDIIGIFISNDIKLLVLRESVFTSEFINLKTGASWHSFAKTYELSYKIISYN